MDAIGISQPVIIAAPVHFTVPDLQQIPALPDPGKSGGDPQAGLDAQSAEQTRVATVQKLSQQIANIYVVSDQTFTIFKDSTGQYITRFTSLRDGKVTYIPEPTLYKMGGSQEAPLLKIQA